MERMLFTLRDSAAMLGVSRNRVHELINSERLASVKPGRSRRISIDPAVCARGDGGGMSSGRTSGDGSVYQLLRRCSILAGSRLDFDHCGLRVAPSSRRRLRPLRHGLPWG